MAYPPGFYGFYSPFYRNFTSNGTGLSLESWDLSFEKDFWESEVSLSRPNFSESSAYEFPENFRQTLSTRARCKSNLEINRLPCMIVLAFAANWADGNYSDSLFKSRYCRCVFTYTSTQGTMALSVDIPGRGITVIRRRHWFPGFYGTKMFYGTIRLCSSCHETAKHPESEQKPEVDHYCLSVWDLVYTSTDRTVDHPIIDPARQQSTYPARALPVEWYANR
jgi:hypothetical protein